MSLWTNLTTMRHTKNHEHESSFFQYNIKATLFSHIAHEIIKFLQKRFWLYAKNI